MNVKGAGMGESCITGKGGRPKASFAWGCADKRGCVR